MKFVLRKPGSIAAKLFGSSKVKVDYWDSWSAEYTISSMALPILLQLKKEKHGAPNVDNDDVPEELKMSKEDMKKFNEEWADDDKFWKRWDWVLDEIIWGHEQIANDEPDAPYDHPEYIEHRKYDERVANSMRLFGKYYQSLWD